MAACSKDFVMLACTILIGLKGVTDERTDTSRMAKMRKNPADAHAAFITLHIIA